MSRLAAQRQGTVPLELLPEGAAWVRLWGNATSLKLIMGVSLAADVMKPGFQCARTHPKPGSMS